MTGIRRPAAGKILLTTGALAGIVLTGCQSSTGASESAPLTTADTPSATTASSVPMITGAPTSGSSPTVGQTRIPETRSATTTAVPPTTPECKAANLKLSIGSENGAAGHTYGALEFTNKSSTRCVMVGFPGVSYVTGATGQQVGAPAAWVGKIEPQVTVVPGQTVFATLVITNVGVFDEEACRPTPVRGLRVYAPDDTAAMYVDRPGTGCAATPPSPQLQVYAVSKDNNVG